MTKVVDGQRVDLTDDEIKALKEQLKKAEGGEAVKELEQAKKENESLKAQLESLKNQKAEAPADGKKAEDKEEGEDF